MARVRVRVRAGRPSSPLVGPLASLVGEAFLERVGSFPDSRRRCVLVMPCRISSSSTRCRLGMEPSAAART